jgi:hypothetical protein
VFVDLPDLREVDLRDNQISGAFPIEVLTRLTKLEGLYLYENRMTGSIPLDINPPLKKTLTGIFLFNNHFDSKSPSSSSLRCTRLCYVMLS